MKFRLLLVSLTSMLLTAPALGQDRNPREIWNRVFTGDQLGFSRNATALLVEVVADLKPGKALDVGMGQGRNTLFLASKGWDVTGVDISDEGIRQARERAEEAGLKITTVREDVHRFDYGKNQWDLVIGMYMHSLITNNAEKIMESLKPGGLLVIEGFHRDLNQESVQGGYFGFFTNQLLRTFDRLRILHYQDLTTRAEWGGRTQRPIVRFVARKE